MVATRKLDIHEVTDRRIAKPREELKRHESLFVSDQEPKAVFRDICNFNCRNALSKLCGSHFRAPESAEATSTKKPSGS
jgi:hypothetical protein